MLRTHYRQPIDWTVSALDEAEATLDRWYDVVGDREGRGEIADGVREALDDDLNTAAALAELHRLADAPELLKSSAAAMGLLREAKAKREATKLSNAAIDAPAVEKLVAQRAAARADKNWAESDRLRDELAALGVAIRDGKDGTTWEMKR